MATSTTNLGLTKPAGTDKIRIAQINGNMDILDEKIGAVGNTSLQAQVTSQNEAIGITELSSATSLVTLISNMGNLTIRHYFTTNKNNLTDFPQALIDVGAIYYIHIDIEKRGTTIANVTITAVDSVNHPVTITGEYYSGTLYWGLTADALNSNKATYAIVEGTTASDITTEADANYPTGFSSSNSVICGYMVQFSNNVWFTNYENTYVYGNNTGLHIKVPLSGFTSKPFKIMILKIE